MIRRRRAGWGRQHDDRALRIAVAIGLAAGIPVGLLTVNLGWVAGRLVDLRALLP